MIQAGGDLYVGGHKAAGRGASASRIRAGPTDKTFATIDLSDSTFSTSGDYARFFIKDGVRYHHILDLRTGQPARLCRSVTIAAASPVLADAVAKGVFILGPNEGWRWSRDCRSGSGDRHREERRARVVGFEGRLRAGRETDRRAVATSGSDLKGCATA